MITVALTFAFALAVLCVLILMVRRIKAIPRPATIQPRVLTKIQDHGLHMLDMQQKLERELMQWRQLEDDLRAHIMDEETRLHGERRRSPARSWPPDKERRHA